jgi:hypothetical protein
LLWFSPCLWVCRDKQPAAAGARLLLTPTLLLLPLRLLWCCSSGPCLQRRELQRRHQRESGPAFCAV